MTTHSTERTGVHRYRAGPLRVVHQMMEVTPGWLTLGHPMLNRALSLAELSDLIGGIYDCALDPGLWEATLERLTARLELHNSGLAIQAMPSGHPLLIVTTGMPDEYAAQLFDYGPEIVEVFGGLEFMNSVPVGELLTFSQFGDPSLWQSSRYMRDWVSPQGIVDCAIVILARDASTYSSLSLGRHRSAGLVGPHEIESVRLLVPHLRRSAAITRVIEARSLVASSFAAALDALSSAVILVDAELRVVHANAAGSRLLADGDPLAVRSGQVALNNPVMQASLVNAVRGAGGSEAEFGGRSIGISAPRLNGDPALLHVLPLRHGALRPGLVPAATAAIFVSPPSGLALGESVAALLFDLTPAEARVFARLADGDSVDDAYRALGISESTVRTHLHRIFEKTGTRRQSELVKLAASLAAIA
jgi:DNA-binding CsgD family transcriptional regulator/PAS domain-containing protein